MVPKSTPTIIRSSLFSSSSPLGVVGVLAPFVPLRYGSGLVPLTWASFAVMVAPGGGGDIHTQRRPPIWESRNVKVSQERHIKTSRRGRTRCTATREALNAPRQRRKLPMGRQHPTDEREEENGSRLLGGVKVAWPKPALDPAAAETACEGKGSGAHRGFAWVADRNFSQGLGQMGEACLVRGSTTLRVASFPEGRVVSVIPSALLAIDRRGRVQGLEGAACVKGHGCCTAFEHRDAITARN